MDWNRTFRPLPLRVGRFEAPLAVAPLASPLMSVTAPVAIS